MKNLIFLCFAVFSIFSTSTAYAVESVFGKESVLAFIDYKFDMPVGFPVSNEEIEKVKAFDDFTKTCGIEITELRQIVVCVTEVYIDNISSKAKSDSTKKVLSSLKKEMKKGDFTTFIDEESYLLTKATKMLQVVYDEMEIVVPYKGSLETFIDPLLNTQAKALKDLTAVHQHEHSKLKIRKKAEEVFRAYKYKKRVQLSRLMRTHAQAYEALHASLPKGYTMSFVKK